MDVDSIHREIRCRIRDAIECAIGYVCVRLSLGEIDLLTVIFIWGYYDVHGCISYYHVFKQISQ